MKLPMDCPSAPGAAFTCSAEVSIDTITLEPQQSAIEPQPRIGKTRGLRCGTRILVGDARQRLSDLPDQSVHCVITSPPYWGLRAYTDAPGMIGLEPTFDEHLENLLDVFDEVRRVLRDDGTLWINYGDRYAHDKKWGGATGGKHVAGLHGSDSMIGRGKVTTGLPAKSLMLLPARLAMAMQDAGWILRSEIIWGKLNPLPEPVRDRPTSAHEKLFLFAKQSRYFYDAAAVRTPGSPNTHARRSDGQMKPRKGADPNDNRAGTWTYTRTVEEQAEIGAHLRNVWWIAGYPFGGAHFATFPPALCEPPVRAGTSEHGVCSSCGTPWRRKHRRAKHRHRREPSHVPGNTSTRVDSTGWVPASRPTDKWVSGCSCGAGLVAATVLDPFSGAGTAGLVANREHRNAILIEVDPGYAQMAADRITGAMGMYADVQVA